MTRASQNPRGTLCRYPQPLGNAGGNAQIVAGGAGIPAPPATICAGAGRCKCGVRAQLIEWRSYTCATGQDLRLGPQVGGAARGAGQVGVLTSMSAARTK